MNVAMILAGGVGSRVGAAIPKQFIQVQGKPILIHTLEVFQADEAIDAIELVCIQSHMDVIWDMVRQYGITKVRWVCTGGATYQDSVLNGLRNLEPHCQDDDIVLIHFGVSPFVDQEIIDDSIKERHFEQLHVIDFGCGKSYLTFLLYYYLHEIKHINVQITGLDLKADVIEKCNQAARKYRYDQLHFSVGSIADFQCKAPVDMVVTLHACDTATDYALMNAVLWDAAMIFSVPCCQHELNHQIQSEDFSILTRYGIIQERVAAAMTDAIRANLLQACGYKTQLLEFIDFAHTPKNILIRATKANIPRAARNKALDEVLRLTEEFHLTPCLLELLRKNGRIVPPAEK